MTTRKLLFIQRQPSGIAPREALEAALVASVFEQQVAVLFREDGVRQLVSHTDEEATGTNELTLKETIAMLADYGIEAIYVCSRSLKERKIDSGKLRISVRPLSLEKQAALIASHAMVISD